MVGTIAQLDEVALDSNCLSYIIDALTGVEQPKDALAAQKVALVRLWMYKPGTLWTLPTVKKEFERISDPVRRANHLSWTSVHFGVYPLTDPAGVDRRAASLRELHADDDDRHVLAEAEDIGAKVLLTFDTAFIDHLGAQAKLQLVRPAEFWTALAIPAGTKPSKIPWPDNPLASQTWWKP